MITARRCLRLTPQMNLVLIGPGFTVCGKLQHTRAFLCSVYIVTGPLIFEDAIWYMVRRTGTEMM